jgi:multidrug transporter EmrE-like cation transporter
MSETTKLAFSPRSAAALLYLIFVGAIAGFSAYAYALKHLPVATVSLYAYINPIIAVVLGTLVLQEPFNARMFLAALRSRSWTVPHAVHSRGGPGPPEVLGRDARRHPGAAGGAEAGAPARDGSRLGEL